VQRWSLWRCAPSRTRIHARVSVPPRLLAAAWRVPLFQITTTLWILAPAPTRQSPNIGECKNEGKPGFDCTLSRCDNGTLLPGACSKCCDASALLENAEDLGLCTNKLLSDNYCASVSVPEYNCARSYCLDGALTNGTCTAASLLGLHSEGTGLLVDCERGQFCPGAVDQDTDGVLMYACEAGTYADQPRAAICPPCPGGEHTQSMGQIECTKCPTRGVNCFEREGGTSSLEAKFWRNTEALPVLETTMSYACDARVANASDYTFTCLEGHDRNVPQCGACLEGCWHNGEVRAACGDHEAHIQTTLMALVLLFVGLVIWKLWPHKPVMSSQFDIHKVFLERMTILLQILWSLKGTFWLNEGGNYPQN